MLDYILPMDNDDEEGKVSTPRKSGGKKSPISVSPSNSQSSDEDETSILANLIEDVKTLQSVKLNNTIKFGGLGIADLQDCLIWVDRYLPGYQFGLFMDPLLILDLVHGEDHVKGGSEGGSILNKMNLQAKLNMR